MSEINQQNARAFAFAGATLLLGVVVFILTQGLIPFIQLPGVAGPVFAVGYFLIFFNLSLALARRFCSRTFELEQFPYILGVVLVLPMSFMSILTGRLSGFIAYFLFITIIVIASMAGAFLGVRSGCKRREQLVKEAMDSKDHDTVSSE